MSTEGLIVTVVILIAGVLMLALPFVRRAQTGGTVSVEREALIVRYERILAALRDIDEDHRLGKMPDDVYQTERDRLTEQGVTVLAALEKAGGHKPTKAAKKYQTADARPQAAVANNNGNGKHLPAADGANAEEALDAAIEQAIASYVKAKSGTGE